jgi:hypothetical protein
MVVTSGLLSLLSNAVTSLIEISPCHHKDLLNYPDFKGSCTARLQDRRQGESVGILKPLLILQQEVTMFGEIRTTHLHRLVAVGGLPPLRICMVFVKSAGTALAHLLRRDGVGSTSQREWFWCHSTCCGCPADLWRVEICDGVTGHMLDLGSKVDMG